jgi:hypothetical protein
MAKNSRFSTIEAVLDQEETGIQYIDSRTSEQRSPSAFPTSGDRS